MIKMGDDVQSDNDSLKLPPLVAAVKNDWPHMKGLCTKHKDVVLKLLRGVDECHCTSTLAASNNLDYPKGNNWNRLYDHCFGGGSESRGLLAGHLPKLPSPSRLKQKISDIWSFLKKENAKHPNLFDEQLVRIARRQEMEYEATKSKEQEAANKQKQSDAKLQEDMQSYQAGLGSLPPSAKGTVGAGRRQHSTNLKTNEPAIFSYANKTTNAEIDNFYYDTEDSTTDKIHPPPKKYKPKKVTKNASTVHGNTTAQIEQIGNNLMAAMNKFMGGTAQDEKKSNNVGSKRKRSLHAKKEELEKTMLFYQKFPNNTKMQSALDEATDTYMEVSKELQECISDTEDE